MEVETHFPYATQSPPPPQSVTLVAACSWGWAPGHGRNECYFITGSPSRCEWLLWARFHCDVADDWLWHNVAHLTSEQPLSRKRAAELLLEAVWRVERAGYGGSTQGLTIDPGDVLSLEEIEQIAARTLGGATASRA